MKHKTKKKLEKGFSSTPKTLTSYNEYHVDLSPGVKLIFDSNDYKP